MMARATVDITLTPQEHRLLRSAIEEALLAARTDLASPHGTTLTREQSRERASELESLLEGL